MTDDSARLRRIHGSLIARCYRPHCALYPLYGGVGAGVCFDWVQPRVGLGHFVQWGLDTGYVGGRHIVRLDDARHFSPDNCTWEEGRERHPRRDLARGEYRGETLTVEEVAARPECAVPLATLRQAPEQRWTLEAAASTPFRWSTRSAEVEAFGEVRSITAWSKDPRCRVTADSLHYRLERGMPPELAITMERRR